MPSFGFKRSLLPVLVVIFAIIGQWHVMAARFQGAATSQQASTNYSNNRHQGIAFERFSTHPSKQTDATEKRHKRLLIGKAWQPVVVFTFIKRYRLVTVPADYSSPHILQRTAFVFSLRGPPALA